MEAANIVNTTCHEIINIRNVYYEFYENVLNINKVKRQANWRISSFELVPGSTFKKFNVDVTDWDIEETINRTVNGPVSGNRLKGFTPKLNEFVECYFNEFVRRPLVVVYETFNGEFYLFGGTSCKTRFSFKKAIAGRNGYEVEFASSNSESSLIIDDTDIFPAPANVTNKVTITMNGDDFVEVVCGNTYNVVVKNEDDTEVGEKIGSEWIVPSGEAPSGVLLQWPMGQQYTSFRTGDEGSRMQAGYFNYSRPAMPEVIAELDYSLGANYWARLVADLKVNGVSSKIRFTDVDGGQTWSGTGNKDKVTIDKLSGTMFYRIENDLGGQKTWNNSIDDALTFSVVVDGITYDDWYLVTREEFELLMGEITAAGTGNIEDPISAAVIWDRVSSGASENWTSTTQSNSSSNAYSKGYNPSTYIRPSAKTTTYYPFLVRDARSLITAP